MPQINENFADFFLKPKAKITSYKIKMSELQKIV